MNICCVADEEVGTATGGQGAFVVLQNCRRISQLQLIFSIP
nr:hypothetical protein Iba_chr13cCG15180 [Ipomoea batatas]